MNYQRNLYSCEECSSTGEYLCVGCDRFLCQEHFTEHLCSWSEVPQLPDTEPEATDDKARSQPSAPMSEAN